MPPTDQPSMPDPFPIEPIDAPFDAVVTPPGSKSETNRSIVLAALANGVSTIRNALTDADDARRAIDAIRTLGARATFDGSTITIEGVGGSWRVPSDGATVDLNNAGTATRFLTAAAVLSPGPVTITGNARMRQRPIGQLAEALASLGASISFAESDGCPPLTITPPAEPLRAPSVRVGTPDSSQFVSALLMIGPWIPGGITVRIEGEVTSAPYLAMTIEMLDRIGASVDASGDLRTLRCGPPIATRPGLDAFELAIEPDASGASYWWTAAAITPGATARVPGLSDRSIQGDVGYVRLLERMGCRVDHDDSGIGVTGPTRLSPLLADLADMPDTAMSLAVACCFASGASVIRGLRTLRVKETDRIAAIETELTKIGADVRVQGDDAITITPPPGGIAGGRVAFDTYDDHRMAMSLALIGLRRPGVAINDPLCVNKTYPSFWSDLATLQAQASSRPS
ncbi:MAG: 3-phosphoshikimate 1-carboxyvinyltransferase [Planctomycetota bacterium]